MAIEQALVREILAEIVKSKPDIRLNDHKWLLAMLKDLYNPLREMHHSDCFKEMNSLANCLEWGTVQLIRNSYGKTLSRSEANTILHELVHDYGLQEDLSRWCIETWCIALGKIIDLSLIDNITRSTTKALYDLEPNYSQQVFRETVYQKLKNNRLDIDLKLELVVKGKQLELSDDEIKSIIKNTSMLIIKEKQDEVANRNKDLNTQSAISAQAKPIDRAVWIKTGGWTMFGCNMQRSRCSPFVGPLSNQIKWKYLAGAGGYISLSSPAIDYDGTVYFGGYDNKLYSVDAKGKLKWTVQTGKTNKGLISSPAIGINGNVYIGSFDKKLYAISPKGNIIWTFDTNDWIRSSPAVGSDGTIYIGSYDNNLYAIDQFGSMKWTFPLGFQIWSSPTIGINGTIYINCMDNNLYAINPNGTLKWKCIIGKYDNSSVAIGPDGTIYTTGSNNKLFALEPNGSLKWVFKPNNFFAEFFPENGFTSPAIGKDNSICIGNRDRHLYVLYPDGTLNWSTKFDAELVSSPAIDARGTIYIGCNDNKLYAFNSSGNYRWSVETSDVVISSPAIGEDGTIYFGSMDGTLYAIGPGNGL